jgi:hypothetical protein
MLQIKDNPGTRFPFRSVLYKNNPKLLVLYWKGTLKTLGDRRRLSLTMLPRHKYYT